MATNILLTTGRHREVCWSERYSPPEPGMTLLDERIVSDGQRCMFVWGWQVAPPGGQVEIVCWAEPCETLHDADLSFNRQSSKAV